MNGIRFFSVLFVLCSYQASNAFWGSSANQSSIPVIQAILNDEELRKAIQNSELRSNAIKHLKEDIDACSTRMRQARKEYEIESEKQRELQQVMLAQMFVFCKEPNREPCQEKKKELEAIAKQAQESIKKIIQRENEYLLLISNGNDCLVGAQQELNELNKKIAGYREEKARQDAEEQYMVEVAESVDSDIGQDEN